MFSFICCSARGAVIPSRIPNILRGCREEPCRFPLGIAVLLPAAPSTGRCHAPRQPRVREARPRAATASCPAPWGARLCAALVPVVLRGPPASPRRAGAAPPPSEAVPAGRVPVRLPSSPRLRWLPRLLTVPAPGPRASCECGSPDLYCSPADSHCAAGMRRWDPPAPSLRPAPGCARDSAALSQCLWNCPMGPALGFKDIPFLFS